MSRFLIACLSLAILSLAPVAAQLRLPATHDRLPAGFFEEFALSEDRGKTLDALLPGTVEHFYFSSLHQQQQGELGTVDHLLAAWRKAHGESADYRQIETRQALLKASTDPATTYAYLEKELGLQFNDRRVIPGESPNAPIQLDPNLVSTETMLRKALGKNSKSTIQNLHPALLETLVRRTLTPNQRGWVLDALPRPDVPGLVDLVVQDMASSNKISYGSRRIHSKLTLAQLEALRASRPEVLANEAYVHAVMQRLAPRFPETLEDRADQLAYLERAWDFASLLPPAFVSLKAHLLYHWIEFDLDGGDLNEEALVAYLRLPRQSQLSVRPRDDSRPSAKLGEKFKSITPFGAIGSETALIREALLQVFRSSDHYQRYVGLLKSDFVRRTFAEARLLYGSPGKADTYVKMLGAKRAEALRQRVDIQFARSNPRHFTAEEQVTLQVDVKNVDRMIVKVFEIDPVAYFDRFGRPVSSKLNLDGLVANESRVLEFDAPPMRQVRRAIQMDALSKPGTYVLELIGGGVSSRVVVSKGQLHVLQQATAAGHLLRVVDGDRKHRKDAIVRFGGRDYLPNERGEILVPYSPAGRSTKKVLLRSGRVTSTVALEHDGESYRLRAPIHTPLGGLLEGMNATIVARPMLTLNGLPIPTAALEDAALHVTATTKDGTVSQSIASGFDFSESGDIVHGILVPERVDNIKVQVRGKVRSLTLGKDVEVSAKAVTFPVQQRHAESPFHSYLTQNESGYALDLLGRAGEPIADTEVQVSLKNRLVGTMEWVRLKTDQDGRVHLGRLTEIDVVGVASPAHAANHWTLHDALAAGIPRSQSVRVGQSLRIPYSAGMNGMTRSLASLLAVGDREQALRDHFDALSWEGGYLVVNGLPEGEYRLTLKHPGDTIRLTVLEGSTGFGHIVGEGHAVTSFDKYPLQITQVTKDDDALIVQLGGVSASARVHVVATRFVEPISAETALGLRSKAWAQRLDLGARPAKYQSGRKISDEYRYILDRRLAHAYPGNMLTRPGYLLNPWEIQETDDAMAEDGLGGTDFASDSPFGIGGGAGAGAPFGGRSKANSGFHTPDFLAEGAAFLTDLRPDEDGQVRIPLAALGDNHIVQIVAMDDAVTVDELVVRSEVPRRLRERRLVDVLDPATPTTQQRRIEYLGAGDSYVIRDAPNAGAKTFGSLRDVFELYRTSGNGGEELAQFDCLARWPSLSPLQKRTKYSELACHELHIFLRRRDPEFFASVVVPHLSSKGHTTFMDDWLLERDLTGYLEPWRMEQLNVVELILLLRATGGDAVAITKDLLALIPQGAFSLDASFAEILASGGLEAEPSTLALTMEATKNLAGPSDKRSGAVSAGQSAGKKIYFARGVAPTRAAVAPPSRNKLAEVRDHNETEPVEEVEEEFEIDEDFKGDELALRQDVEGFYFRDLAETAEYAETHYWKVSLDRMNPELVTVSPFWLDFAAAGSGPFTSESFPLAKRSVTEKLLALAFLDLPFEAEEPKVTAEGRSVTLEATASMFLALEDIAPASRQDNAPALLVGQDFFDPERRTETVAGVTRDRFMTGEFLRGVRYGCRMVVTNPSSSTVQVQLLTQIPEGAIPLGDSHMTRGVPATLRGYGTASLETSFYFPKSGTYRDYPVHVGRADTLFGAASSTTLNVVNEVSQVDETTWDWISQNAAVPEVVQSLREGNPRDLDLGKLAWRMADEPTFQALTDELGTRGLYPDSLWRYAIKHRDPQRSERFLAAQENLVERVGAPFASPLLTLDVRDRKAYEHRAFEPLVNGRTHEFGGERKILNDQFKAQYQRFLTTLTLTAEITSEERMELAYYLLLQDRISEALATYEAIDPEDLQTRIQYDYMTAYMAFYREDVAKARATAAPYRDYPVDLWRSRFRNVLTQANEIEGLSQPLTPNPNDRDESQSARAGAEPLLAIEVQGGQVQIASASIDQVELRYHRMDVEFLFSNSPFVRGDQTTFHVIRPAHIDLLPIPKNQTTFTTPIPPSLSNANVVIEARAAGLSRQATYFTGDLTVQPIERYGQIRVQSKASNRPLPKAYVKVYARLQNGETRFHKDGYTDLRGRFDYVSLSGISGPTATRYALLVIHETAGARMLELPPPPR